MALVFALAGPVLADQVTLRDGTQFPNCRVLSEDAQEVKLDLTRNNLPDKVIPAEDVETIQYSDRGIDYRQAELFFTGGNYDRAVSAFKTIADTAAPGAWQGVYASYYRAAALQRWADSDPSKAPEAVQALNDFVRAHPNSRFIYEARLSLAEALMVQRKLDEVRRLANEVVQSKPNTAWATRGRMLLARVKVQENDAKGALEDFDAVLAGLKDKDAALWAEATTGKGLALLALDRLPEAEKLLSDLIETTQQSALRARAYNALGEAYFKAGLFPEARLKFLRVVVLYFKADPVEHAKALYYAGECFQKLGDQTRANQLFRELVTEYPGSPWAAKSPLKPAPTAAPDSE